MGGAAGAAPRGGPRAFIRRSRRRLALLAALVVLCHVTLAGGAAARANALARADALGVQELTRRFEPALAPGLYAALGPQPAYYLALGTFVVSAALLGAWRRAPRALLAAGLAAVLALELWAAGSLFFGRPSPLALDPTLPIPEDWRAAWQGRGAYPSRHALIAAALAGIALFAWAPIGVAAVGLALCGAATAVYFGAAHVTDVAVGVLLGGASAGAGWLGAGLARPDSVR